jgi:hypothetical protein
VTSTGDVIIGVSPIRSSNTISALLNLTTLD